METDYGDAQSSTLAIFTKARPISLCMHALHIGTPRANRSYNQRNKMNAQNFLAITTTALVLASVAVPGCSCHFPSPPDVDVGSTIFVVNPGATAQDVVIFTDAEAGVITALKTVAVDTARGYPEIDMTSEANEILIKR